MAILPPAAPGATGRPSSSLSTLTLELIGASEEVERDSGYQSELARIEAALSKLPTPPQPRIRFQKSATGGSWLTGEFLIQLIEIADAPVAAILTAWLTAKLGRKVRIRVGDLEAEASTPDQVERLLEKASAVRERISESSSADTNVQD